MASGPITSWQIEEENVKTVTDFIFLGSKITADVDCSHEIKDACSLEESYDQPRQCIKKKRHHFANNHLYSQSYGFPVVMYRCENWTIKRAECRRIDACKLVLEKILEIVLDCKEIKPVTPKGNQP